MTEIDDRPEVQALRNLAPRRELNAWFLQIVEEGTGKVFEPEHNRHWLEVGRPIVEAFLHARFFLEMAVRYGRSLDSPPTTRLRSRRLATGRQSRALHHY